MSDDRIVRVLEEIRNEADRERADQVQETLRLGSVSPVWLEIELRDFSGEGLSQLRLMYTPERIQQAFAQKRQLRGRE